jgi:tripartite-type tricarboxylate transporter receptor subunit TctC
MLFRILLTAYSTWIFAAAEPASAQQWPSRTIRVIVPFSSGSASDLVARVVSERISTQIGQPVIVENRPGAGGAIGVRAVADADPNGYTVLVHSNALVTGPAIQKMNYDPVQDVAAVAPLGSVPLVLVTAPAKNITTAKELVAAAKARPEPFNYGTAGIGTPPHLAMERFRMAAGFRTQMIPFRGAAEIVPEVLTGRLDLCFCSFAVAVPLIRDGKLVPLVVNGTSRSLSLPDVPTTLEAGFPDSEFELWIGTFVPKKTPAEIVNRLNQEAARALADPGVQEKLAKLGVELPKPMTPAEFESQIVRDASIAISLAKAAGIEAK